MVGNDLIEDTAAKKLGMKTVIFTKKVFGENDLEKIDPDYYIDEFDELINIVEKLN